MYQSRLHITNGIISFAFDALNGELLEFVREDTADNAVKNHMRPVRSILEGVLLRGNDQTTFYVPRYEEIRLDESLTPNVSVEQREGEASATLIYPRLMSPQGPVDISATVKIELRKDDCRSQWRLTLDNQTDAQIDDVAFPNLTGIWLGETWRDDRLVYPRFAGAKLDNPTAALAAQPPRIDWKWQEYLYGYNLGADCGTADDRGIYTMRLNYTGLASMMWMDLADPQEERGIYLTCRNGRLRMMALRAQSMGEKYPGVMLAIVHRLSVKRGILESDPCIVAFHEGGWHWGADEYRTWFESLDRPQRNCSRPVWFDRSPGLMAHYDFQYQGGGIVHTYRDIPHLMQMAMDLGFNHLLLSGWNKDGFDYGFPHYSTNPALGTEQELKEAIAEAKAMGGHVAFYINARLCNTAFEDQQKRIRKSAIMNHDQSLWIEKYGAANLNFASMCINETDWRHELAETVRYLTHDIGADSMYLDQWAMATSVKCYHPGHTEHTGDPCAWNQGYEKLLDEMEQNWDDLALFYEGCNDIYGPYAAAQLITTLSCPPESNLPEVYKYTFPTQTLTDMMNPRRHSAMRPEHVARHSTDLMYRAFVNDAYFWCYDLEWDNNWRQDAEQKPRLRAMADLRRAWLERWGHGRFTDTVGLISIPARGMFRRFLLEDGVLIAAADRKGLAGEVVIPWQKDAPNAYMLTMENRKELQPVHTEIRLIGGEQCAAIVLPATEAAVIVLKTTGND